jgi:hypothetical protein
MAFGIDAQASVRLGGLCQNRMGEKLLDAHAGALLSYRDMSDYLKKKSQFTYDPAEYL